jgi:hypothetical protein
MKMDEKLLLLMKRINFGTEWAVNCTQGHVSVSPIEGFFVPLRLSAHDPL